ncbi:MAG: Ribonuclease VapC [Gemmatimonadetes bacterium]|nr:Ribonuclease VapC [Gemmatimonadota bacterium]
MADIYALDTNVYVNALRNADRLAKLKRFLMRAGTRLRVHAVVALELRAGARTPAHDDAVARLLSPYAERERVVVPSFDAFSQAGRVLAALGVRERVVLADAPGSLTNDAVLAASCRETGVVLVTENHKDFAAIQRHLRGFRFADAESLLH